MGFYVVLNFFSVYNICTYFKLTFRLANSINTHIVCFSTNNLNKLYKYIKVYLVYNQKSASTFLAPYLQQFSAVVQILHFFGAQ